MTARLKQLSIALVAGSALGLAALTASAQQPTAPVTATPPAKVGVSERTAADAASKAVPRTDTGTLVRTAPTATDRAKAATTDMAPAPAATGSTAASTTPMTTTTSAPMRRPKADRN